MGYSDFSAFHPANQPNFVDTKQSYQNRPLDEIKLLE
jgi:hypothetical protein